MMASREAVRMAAIWASWGSVERFMLFFFGAVDAMLLLSRFAARIET
jgi:hypothetical protein